MVIGTTFLYFILILVVLLSNVKGMAFVTALWGAEDSAGVVLVLVNVAVASKERLRHRFSLLLADALHDTHRFIISFNSSGEFELVDHQDLSMGRPALYGVQWRLGKQQALFPKDLPLAQVHEL